MTPLDRLTRIRRAFFETSQGRGTLEGNLVQEFEEQKQELRPQTVVQRLHSDKFWTRVLRHVPVGRRTLVREEVKRHHMAVVTTTYPIIEEDNSLVTCGRLRFRPDPAIRFLVDKYRPLEELALHFGERRKRSPSLKALYRRMGYSLDGFAEVFGL